MRVLLRVHNKACTHCPEMSRGPSRMESYFCVKTFRRILLLKIIALQIEGSLNPVNSAELLGAAAPSSVLFIGAQQQGLPRWGASRCRYHPVQAPPLCHRWAVVADSAHTL